MASSELKQLALIAKQRLRNANYNKENPVNNYKVKNNYFIKNISAMKKNSGKTEFVTITEQEDLQFLKKVFSMLSSNDEIYNPIGRLVDKDHFEKLNNAQKQQYVFMISEKYNIAKEKYLKEKSNHG